MAYINKQRRLSEWPKQTELKERWIRHGLPSFYVVVLPAARNSWI